MTKVQRAELFGVIRYSYLSNDELVALSHNKMFSEASNMIIEGLKVRLQPAAALEHKEAFSINLKPRILYLSKNKKAKVLPDGSIIEPSDENPKEDPPVIVQADGTEIILAEGNQIEDTVVPPIDKDTGLPLTGVDINTGLPVPLPKGVDFIDPATGKK
jgi:hypothetical protein